MIRNELWSQQENAKILEKSDKLVQLTERSVGPDPGTGRFGSFR